MCSQLRIKIAGNPPLIASFLRPSLGNKYSIFFWNFQSFSKILLMNWKDGLYSFVGSWSESITEQQISKSSYMEQWLLSISLFTNWSGVKKFQNLVYCEGMWSVHTGIDLMCGEGDRTISDFYCWLYLPACSEFCVTSV